MLLRSSMTPACATSTLIHYNRCESSQIACGFSRKGLPSLPFRRPLKCREHPREIRMAARDRDVMEDTTTTSFLEGRGDHLPSHKADEASTSTIPETRGIPYILVAALASAGVIETAYLAWTKLTNTTVVCPAAGSCETVLSSSYAQVFGIPLSIFGMLAYATVAGLAARGAVKQAQDDVTRYSILGAATVLASTSSYLLYILATRFTGQGCTWCLTSAGISFAILLSTLQGFSKRELQEGSLAGGALLTATVLGLTLAWGDIDVSAIGDYEMPFQEPRVTTTSPPQAVDLARRLKDAGAKFYGAFWCSHCLEQKEIFGKAAVADLPYIECYPTGYFKGVKLAAACRDANLNGFPSWVINGQLIEGEQTLEQLEVELAKAAAAMSP